MQATTVILKQQQSCTTSLMACQNFHSTSLKINDLLLADAAKGVGKHPATISLPRNNASIGSLSPELGSEEINAMVSSMVTIFLPVHTQLESSQEITVYTACESVDS